MKWPLSSSIDVNEFSITLGTHCVRYVYAISQPQFLYFFRSLSISWILSPALPPPFSHSISLTLFHSLPLSLSFFLSIAIALCLFSVEWALFLVVAFVHFRVEVGDYPPNYHSTLDYLIFGIMKPNMHYFHDFKSRISGLCLAFLCIIFRLCFCCVIFHY